MHFFSVYIYKILGRLAALAGILMITVCVAQSQQILLPVYIEPPCPEDTLAKRYNVRFETDEPEWKIQPKSIRFENPNHFEITEITIPDWIEVLEKSNEGLVIQPKTPVDFTKAEDSIIVRVKLKPDCIRSLAIIKVIFVNQTYARVRFLGKMEVGPSFNILTYSERNQFYFEKYKEQTYIGFVAGLELVEFKTSPALKNFALSMGLNFRYSPIESEITDKTTNGKNTPVESTQDITFYCKGSLPLSIMNEKLKLIDFTAYFSLPFLNLLGDISASTKSDLVNDMITYNFYWGAGLCFHLSNNLLLEGRALWTTMRSDRSSGLFNWSINFNQVKTELTLSLINPWW
ncbi:MAG: hypothetical protein HW421_2509 [Ignavibacteria bacterium]|nr:hypothetical protein [Ignavibacteria bacterium]